VYIVNGFSYKISIFIDFFQRCQAEEQVLDAGSVEGDGYFLVVFIVREVYDDTFTEHLVLNTVANF
jgi:hypothetical protein